MMRLSALILILTPLLQDKDPKNTEEAMYIFRALVGEWKCTGMPEEGMKGEAWEETAKWEYKIEKKVYSLKVDFTDGKFHKDGILTWEKKKKEYTLNATLADGKKAVYKGKYEDQLLTLTRVPRDKDEKLAKDERLTINVLHKNRYLVSVDTRKKGRKAWTLMATLGCTKKGVPFVKKGAIPECIITGGYATSSVKYKGKSYYIC